MEGETPPVAVDPDSDLEQLQQMIVIGQGIDEDGETSISSPIRSKRSQYTPEERHKLGEWYEETHYNSDLVVKKFKQEFPGRPLPARSTIYRDNKRWRIESNRNGVEWSTLHGSDGIVDEVDEVEAEEVEEVEAEEVEEVEDAEETEEVEKGVQQEEGSTMAQEENDEEKGDEDVIILEESIVQIVGDGETLHEEKFEIEENERKGKFSTFPHQNVNVFDVDERFKIARWYYEFDSVSTVQNLWNANFPGRPTPTRRTIRKCAKIFADCGAALTARLRKRRQNFSRSSEAKREKILQTHRKNPNLTPDCVAILLNCDAGFVKKVLQKSRQDEAETETEENPEAETEEKPEAETEAKGGSKKMILRKKKGRNRNFEEPADEIAVLKCRRSPRLAKKATEPVLKLDCDLGPGTSNRGPDFDSDFDPKFGSDFDPKLNPEFQSSAKMEKISEKFDPEFQSSEKMEENWEDKDLISRLNKRLKTGKLKPAPAPAGVILIKCSHCELRFDTRLAFSRHLLSCPKIPERRQYFVQEHFSGKNFQNFIPRIKNEKFSNFVMKQEKEQQDDACSSTPLIPFDLHEDHIESIPTTSGLNFFSADEISFNCSHCEMKFLSTVALQKHRAACLSAVGFQLHPISPSPARPSKSPSFPTIFDRRKLPDVFRPTPNENLEEFLSDSGEISGSEEIGFRVPLPLQSRDRPAIQIGDEDEESLALLFGAAECPNCMERFEDPDVLADHVDNCSFVLNNENSDAADASDDDCGADGAMDDYCGADGALDDNYEVQVALDEAYDADGAPDYAYDADGAPDEAYDADLAPDEAYDADGAPDEVYDSRLVPDDTFGADGASDETYGAGGVADDNWEADGAPDAAFDGAGVAPDDNCGAGCASANIVEGSIIPLSFDFFDEKLTKKSHEKKFDVADSDRHMLPGRATTCCQGNNLQEMESIVVSDRHLLPGCQGNNLQEM